MNTVLPLLSLTYYSWLTWRTLHTSLNNHTHTHTPGCAVPFLSHTLTAGNLVVRVIIRACGPWLALLYIGAAFISPILPIALYLFALNLSPPMAPLANVTLLEYKERS